MTRVTSLNCALGGSCYNMFVLSLLSITQIINENGFCKSMFCHSVLNIKATLILQDLCTYSSDTNGHATQE